MIQQSWTYIQEKWKPSLEKIRVPQCLQQHYLQHPRDGNNASAHQQTTVLRCGIYPMEYYSAIKISKHCHLKQYRWT